MSKSDLLVEKRKGMKSLPLKYQLEDLLDRGQLAAVSNMETFGFYLKIVRRKGLLHPIALMQNDHTKKWIEIRQHGEVLGEPHVKVR